jgi:hypothetical protein
MSCEKIGESTVHELGDDFYQCASLSTIAHVYDESRMESRMYKRMLSNATKNSNSKMAMIFKMYLD